MCIGLVRSPFTSLQWDAAGDLFAPIDFGILPSSDNVKRSMTLLLFVLRVHLEPQLLS